MKGTKITKEMFSMIKALAAGGAKNTEITKYTGIGDVTIGRIRKAETLEEYKKIVTDAKKQYLERVRVRSEEEEASEWKDESKPVAEDNRVAVAQVSAYQMNRVLEELTKQNELLKLISAKLVYIVEQLS